MKTLHPALALFKRLFDEVAADPPPHSPTSYVERSYFHDQCKKAGINAPQNAIEMMKWEEDIGLRAFVKKTLDAHYRATGTKPSPMERGARRLDAHLKRHDLT